METKELKIQIPEGFEIDKEKSTFEKIVFKKKDKNTKPRSWEEYCENYERTGNEYYIDVAANIVKLSSCWEIKNELPQESRNILPTKELAEAFLAMMQLMSLRQAWIGDWEPDYEMIPYKGYAIKYYKKRFVISPLGGISRPLSFPTYEMCYEFFNCFKDLLEQAKILL